MNRDTLYPTVTLGVAGKADGLLCRAAQHHFPHSLGAAGGGRTGSLVTPNPHTQTLGTGPEL